MFSKIKETALHSVVYGFGQVLSKAVGFLLIPLYTRHLSTSDFGVNALLSTATSLVAVLWGIGLNTALFRSYYNYDTELERKTVVSTAFYTLFISALTLALLSFVGASVWSKLIFGELGYERYCIVVFCTAALTLLQAIPFAVYRARNWSRKYVMFNLVFVFIRLGLLIYLVAGKKLGVWGIVIGNFWATLISTVVMMFTISRSIVWVYSVFEAKKMLRFGLPLIIVNLSGLILNSSDRYFLRLNGLDQVGIYDLGYKFGMLLQILFVQPLALIWPSMMFSTAKSDYAPKYYSRVFTYVSLIGIFLWLGISLLSREIVMLMAESSYWAAIKIIPIIGFSYLFNILQRILSVGIELEGRTEYHSIIFAFSAIINLFLNILLIPSFGILGAACATFLSFGLICLLKYLFSKRLYAIPYERWRILKIFVLGIIIYGLGSLLHLQSLLLGFLLKMALVFLYPFILWAIGFYHVEEIEEIEGFLKKYLSRKIAL